MRINKYLSHCGIASRRAADELLRAGRVTVNGLPAEFGMQVEPDDEVCVDGKTVEAPEQKTYLMFNKPKGLVCTSSDKEEANIFDYLKLPGHLTYAGRLDKDSEGLLLLTDDGDLINALMKGSASHEKEYVVKTTRPVTEEQLSKMAEGLYLEEIGRATKPCRVYKSGTTEFHIILTQGINRQIRRMCRAVGLHVAALKRIRIANLKLSDLPTGKTRPLTENERTRLMEIAGRG